MKHFLWGLSLIAVILGTAQNTSAQTPSQSNKVATASVSGRGYTLTPPLGWSVTKFTDDCIFISATNGKQYQPTVTVASERLKKALTLNEATAKQLQAVKAGHGFNISSPHLVIINGIPGSTLTCLQKTGSPVRLEQMSYTVIVRGSIAYALDYQAQVADFAAQASDYDAILQSVRWNNKSLSAKVPSLASLAGRMTNQVYSEQTSPDGRTVATLAYHDGLTYGYEFLSLCPRRGWHPLRQDDPVPADEVAEMADEGINKVTWAGPHTLIVWYDKATPKDCFVKRGKSWRNVRIVWKADPSR